MKTLPALILTGLSVASFSLQAEDLSKQLYAGAGLSHNRVDLETFDGDAESASGMQFFGGYKLGQRNGFDLAIEAGYMETADFVSNVDSDVKGVWIAGVAKKNLPEIDSRMSALVRGGVDLGDDDGLLMGFGVEMKIHPQVFIRGEYINKDITQSYQLNAGFEF